MRWLGLRLGEGGLVGIGHWFECVRKSGFGGRVSGIVVIKLYYYRSFKTNNYLYGTMEMLIKLGGYLN